MTRAFRSPLLVLLALLLILAVAPAAQAACPKTSLPAIQDEVMCPICGVPLGNAGGPSAEDERDFIRGLVEQCKSKDEIKTALIDEYGEAVLAEPPKHGFGLAAYVVPVVVGLAAMLGVVLGALSWRRGRAREAATRPDGEDKPDPGESALDQDFQRYDL
jgi:cytochrome c-type biogenesis protein CcmH